MPSNRPPPVDLPPADPSVVSVTQYDADGRLLRDWVRPGFQAVEYPWPPGRPPVPDPPPDNGPDPDEPFIVDG